MSDFNWCHGPICHKSHTVDRVRGVKGSKVLRTRKVPQNKWNSNNYWRFFCSQGCMLHFIQTHIDKVIAIAPRPEALETPIEVTKETVDSPYWGKRVETRIKEVDNSERVG